MTWSALVKLSPEEESADICEAVLRVAQAVAAWQAQLSAGDRDRHPVSTIGRCKRRCAVCRVHRAAGLVESDVTAAAGLAVDNFIPQTKAPEAAAAIEVLRHIAYIRKPAAATAREHLGITDDPRDARRNAAQQARNRYRLHRRPQRSGPQVRTVTVGDAMRCGLWNSGGMESTTPRDISLEFRRVPDWHGYRISCPGCGAEGPVRLYARHHPDSGLDDRAWAECHAPDHGLDASRQFEHPLIYPVWVRAMFAWEVAGLPQPQPYAVGDWWPHRSSRYYVDDPEAPIGTEVSYKPWGVGGWSWQRRDWPDLFAAGEEAGVWEQQWSASWSAIGGWSQTGQ
ncbi:hypothetical protein Snas_6237 [Stackebrandtia nassauensis DSM 44728]|uniref:Uncharacterized protein n=2 Tax=Stackebrandtia TaxID=283810 RepID=D3Q2V7_STANL|nr:hypothetical protein Snas_6237 [Stackebrandtia nassauensis DSM 44728]